MVSLAFSLYFVFTYSSRDIETTLENMMRSYDAKVDLGLIPRPYAWYDTSSFAFQTRRHSHAGTQAIDLTVKTVGMETKQRKG